MAARPCDVSITERAGVYRIRAHTAAGRAWVCTLGSNFDSALDALEIVVDALPPVPPLLKAWFVIQHAVH
jgi:hypothetical protein